MHVVNAQIKALIEPRDVRVCGKMCVRVPVEAARHRLERTALFVHEKEKEINPLFSQLIPSRWKMRSRSNRSHCSAAAKPSQHFSKANFPPPLPQITGAAVSRPLIFIRLTTGRWCDLPLSPPVPSLHHYRGSQNSRMPVSKATKQDLCPGRDDKR